MPDDAARPPDSPPDAAPPEALGALRRTWRYDAFRPGQAETVAAVLAGRDALSVLPTGGGKSLTYQVPAVLAAPRRAVVLVVSPLIALMRDQVDALARRGVAAAMAHAGMSPRDADQLWTDAEFGRYRLVYVTPERLQTDLFRARASRLPVALLAVDEAHCVSEWGHDFRPAYRRIAEARPLLRDADGRPTPVLAVTATATPDVRRDIVEQLGLRDPAVVVRGFDRPNLVWSVTHTADRERRAADLLREAGGAALVYAGTRAATEAWAVRLGRAGLRAEAYHAGLAPAKRDAVQARWIAGETPVLAATSAFGMGIDKPDVRAVVHVALPPTLEAYYQEAGRAGRDGLPAQAALLVAPDDDRTPRSMAETGHPLAPEVQAVYRAAGSLAQLAIGSAPDGPVTLDAARLASVSGLPAPTVRAAVERLAQAGVWSASEPTSDLVRVSGGPAALRRFAADAAPAVAAFVGHVLRVLPAEAFAGWTPLPLAALVKRTDLPEARVLAGLAFLAERALVDLQPAGAGSVRLVWAGPRTDRAPVDARSLDRARARALARLDEVVAYASGVGCRRQHLLAHFGEPAPPRCGRCDVCLGSLRPATVTPRDEPLLLALLGHIGRGDAPGDWLAGTPATRRDGLLDWLAQEGFVRLDDPLARAWALTPKGQRRLGR
ncbi:MAG TPA: ATP-dependent DNA helicase RecQ [Rubricoccaceae bacterium]|jgi:ATP-dependent DNA helicase RecQ